MFDLFLALFFARTLVVSAWRRFPAGLAGGGAGVLLWLSIAGCGLWGRGASALGMTGVWMFFMFGPSAMPGPIDGVPPSAAVAAHPMLVRLLATAAFAAPFAVAWRRAERLSPLSDEASALKRLGLVFLAPTLLLLGQTACTALAEVAAVGM